jgi:hypothetical protein
MPTWLQKSLETQVDSIPTPPGTKKSVSSYACNAILEKLKLDGARIYTPAECQEPTP